MARAITDVLEIPTAWDEVLSDFFKAHSGFDMRNIKRPNKRRLYQNGIYIPTRYGWQIEKVALIFDVSGSVSGAETSLFKGTILQIMEQCRPKEVRCLCVNTRVMSDDTFEDLDEFRQWKPTGTGGTDMEAGLRFLEEDGYDPDVCIVLTDGETYTSTDNEPGFPVLWVTTSAIDFAYGAVVKMDMTKTKGV
jgi:predicted metal-dependent peptidase